MSEAFDLPLFPLSAHVLPGGRMSLRIFEPRYVRMVKEACASGSGFGICMLNPQGDKTENSHIYPVGTYVTVEDFDLLEDGLLGITVQAHRCFTITEVTTEADDLRIGTCQWRENWQWDEADIDIDLMQTRLREVFDKYPEVNSLYTAPQFNDPIWVVYRWLELLPVNAEQKQYFLKQNECDSAVKYLSQLVQ